MKLYLLTFIDYEDFIVFGVFDTEAQARLEGEEIKRRGAELNDELMNYVRRTTDFTEAELKIYYAYGITMDITELQLNQLHTS